MTSPQEIYSMVIFDWSCQTFESKKKQKISSQQMTNVSTAYTYAKNVIAINHRNLELYCVCVHAYVHVCLPHILLQCRIWIQRNILGLVWTVVMLVPGEITLQ